MTEKKIIKIIIAVLVGIFVLYGMNKIWRHYNYQRIWKKRHVYADYKYKIKEQDSTVNGYFLITPYILFNWKYGLLKIVDTRGNELVNRHVNGVVYDFKQWKTKDGIRYTYIYHNKYLWHSRSGLAPGNVVIMDSMLNIIKDIHLLGHNDIPKSTNQGLDLHDFLLLSDNHYFALAHYEKTVTNIPDTIKHSPNVILAVPIIQEVINDSVVWQWDASCFPEFYAHSRERNNYTDTIPLDYMHVNSIWIDPKDSNLIVSFRHECQVIKISKATGNIMWRLGGPNSDFPLTKDQIFLFQHNVQLTDNNQTLIMVDNGDTAQRRYSRILEFKLDELNKTVTSFTAFKIPEPFSQFMGSVTKRDDNYYISGGSAKYVLVVNRITGKKLFELKGNQSSYRAQFVDNIYGLKNIVKIKKKRLF